MVRFIHIVTALANSADPDQTALKEQSDQNLQCLSFCLYLLDQLLHCTPNYSS